MLYLEHLCCGDMNTILGACCRSASWSVATVRRIPHASEGALCSSEPRSAAVYIMLVVIEVNAPSSSSSIYACTKKKKGKCIHKLQEITRNSQGTQAPNSQAAAPSDDCKLARTLLPGRHQNQSPS